MKYNFSKIEKKWQKYWEKHKLFEAKDFSKKPKYYCLIEFPYPSGDGLHVGHTRSYTAMDIIARKRRMEGYNVLFPIGWDAFGLPTENYAIKTGIHPKIVTKKNTNKFRKQLKSLGFSFDWKREINTSDPDYYKWTQWIFLQFFKHGLAYKSKIPINWCPSCKIGLANEEVINNKCERCGTPTTKKEKEQWLLAITKYAEKLLQGLENVDYLEKIKIQQRNWIGKSEGTLVKFPIADSQKILEVFTTRIDTIFGCTYMVVAPEHQIINDLKSNIINFEEVEKYIEEAKQKSDLQRTELNKEKTGIELKGVKAINPFTKKQIPVFIADYVLANYGTGAVMAVPAHDIRDWDFAKKYNLPIIESIKGGDVSKQAFTEDGILVNSGEFTGLTSKQARQKMTEWLEKNNLGGRMIQYHLRDWIFSRQHYWGEPIPMVNCEKCGWVPVPEKELPVKLPNVKNYKPTDSGESPLAAIDWWVNSKCPKCKGPAKRETDTMPNWAGSSWYFLRYIDPKNKKQLADNKKLKYWMPVDWYNGGMEHTTLHLLYSRFWNQFLYDIKAVPTPEPYKKRTSHGMILGADGEKMSKSRGNVVNPDDVVKQYGADTYRLYQMFMGPFDQATPWDTKGIEGAKRFNNKIWLIGQIKISKKSQNKELEKLLHKTIKKVSEDIETMSFNTAIAALMIFINECYAQKEVPQKIWEDFLKILSPFAPHLSEELWQKLGKKKSICLEQWPKYNKSLIQEGNFTLVIQINGKTRDTLLAPINITQDLVLELALKQENIKKYIPDKSAIKKIIFVPNKLLNIVI